MLLSSNAAVAQLQNTNIALLDFQTFLWLISLHYINVFKKYHNKVGIIIDLCISVDMWKPLLKQKTLKHLSSAARTIVSMVMVQMEFMKKDLQVRLEFKKLL